MEKPIVPESERSLAALIADFLADLKQANRSPHTLRAYESDLRQLAGPSNQALATG